MLAHVIPGPPSPSRADDIHYRAVWKDFNKKINIQTLVNESPWRGWKLVLSPDAEFRIRIELVAVNRPGRIRKVGSGLF